MNFVLRSEEMASLNEKDREWFSGKIHAAITSLQTSEWIKTQISNAVEEFRPKWWRKAGEKFLAVGSPIAICALIVALLAVAFGALYQSFSHVKEETEFRTHTRDELKAIHIEVVSARALISANQPLKKQNQDAATELIVQARQGSIPPIPAPIVRDAGDSFVQASSQDQGAWKVALEYAAYRSLLNTPEIPKYKPESLRASNQAWGYNFVPDNHTPPTLQFSKSYLVPRQQGAHLDLIGKDENTKLDQAPGWLFASGGSATLDGMDIRNVIFEGVQIYYSGKEVILKNVIFIDCKFMFDRGPRTGQLAVQLLTSTIITFPPS